MSNKIRSSILTCRARSATFALVVLLSWVSSVKMAINSSVSVGSRPQSWSCMEKKRKKKNMIKGTTAENHFFIEISKSVRMDTYNQHSNK